MKKRTKWILASAGTAVVVAFAIYLVTRENPNYVQAAKGLEQSKQSAVQAFGTLTWEEYRAERGIASRDDTKAWESIGAAAPSSSVYHDSPVPGDTRLMKAFIADRAWFMDIDDRMKDLTLQHVYDPTYGQWSGAVSVIKFNLPPLWEGGVIGAADAGDPEAIRIIADAVWSFYKKDRSEIDWIGYMTSWLTPLMFEQALLTAAVRNRHKPEVLRAVRYAFKRPQVVSSISSAFAGDVRRDSLELEKLRGLKADEVDGWLDDLLLDVQSAEAMFPMTAETDLDRAERAVGDMYERFSKTFRGIGTHTTDALEARYWQAAVEFYEILIDAEEHPDLTIKNLREFAKRLMSESDASYEVAQLLLSGDTRISTTLLQGDSTGEFERKALRAGIEIVLRFPRYGSLPSEFPKDLRFDDQYGRAAVYRKTSSGFVIYERGLNGVDDGFEPSSPDELRQEDLAYMAFGDDDGIVVCYDPIVPVP